MTFMHSLQAVLRTLSSNENMRVLFRKMMYVKVEDEHWGAKEQGTNETGKKKTNMIKENMVRTNAIFSCFTGTSLLGLITSFTAYALGSEPDKKTKGFIDKIKQHPGIAVLMLTNHWLSLHEYEKTGAQKT